MSFAAAIDRPLPLRMRTDLIVREQWFNGRRHFVIKDPIALTYVYLTEQEHLVLQSLDGETSPAQVQERFRERFAPQQLPPAQLHSFASQLHRQGLVLSDAPGQGTLLADRYSVKNQINLLRLAERLLARHVAGGIDIRTGIGVSAIDTIHSGHIVRLTDGTGTPVGSPSTVLDTYRRSRVQTWQMRLGRPGSPCSRRTRHRSCGIQTRRL
jgi:hypothetical protein